MLLTINSENPQARLIKQAVAILEKDGVIIYPTDSSYALGCSIQSKKSMRRIFQIKQLDPKKPLTFICHNTQQFQQYTKGISNIVFRAIKPNIPGPYTFIFEASKLVPKAMCSPRSTIGVRIPNANIACLLAEYLDQPILSTSIPLEEDQTIQEPDHLYEKYQKRIDCMISSGDIYCRQSAMIDFTKAEPEIIRAGDANLDWLNLG